MDITSLTVAQSLIEFFNAKEADMRSKATMKWYRWALKDLASSYGEVLLVDITTNHMREIKIKHRKQDNRYESGQRPVQHGGYSNESLRDYDTAFRAFWSWCEQEYQLPQNPMSRIERPGEIEQPIKDISWADFVALLSSLIGKDDPGSIRDLAIILFLADTGCRSAGLRNLKVADIDIGRRRALISGEKDRKLRSVPFTEITANGIREWMKIRPRNAETLFCGFYGRHFGKPLRDTALNQMLERRAAQAGITGRFNPHSFRHAAARRFLENGADLETVRKMLGHSKITTTAKIYGSQTDDGLQIKHHRIGPLSQLPKNLLTSGDSDNEATQGEDSDNDIQR